jgi:hypothetical protein
MQAAPTAPSAWDSCCNSASAAERITSRPSPPPHVSSHTPRGRRTALRSGMLERTCSDGCHGGRTFLCSWNFFSASRRHRLLSGLMDCARRRVTRVSAIASGITSCLWMARRERNLHTETASILRDATRTRTHLQSGQQTKVLALRAVHLLLSVHGGGRHRRHLQVAGRAPRSAAQPGLHVPSLDADLRQLHACGWAPRSFSGLHFRCFSVSASFLSNPPKVRRRVTTSGWKPLISSNGRMYGLSVRRETASE